MHGTYKYVREPEKLNRNAMNCDCKVSRDPMAFFSWEAEIFGISSFVTVRLMPSVCVYLAFRHGQRVSRLRLRGDTSAIRSPAAVLSETFH